MGRRGEAPLVPPYIPAQIQKVIGPADREATGKSCLAARLRGCAESISESLWITILTPDRPFGSNSRKLKMHSPLLRHCPRLNSAGKADAPTARRQSRRAGSVAASTMSC